MYEKRVQLPGFLAESRDAVAALFRSAELELEGWLVAGVDDAEVVGHFSSDTAGVMLYELHQDSGSLTPFLA